MCNQGYDKRKKYLIDERRKKYIMKKRRNTKLNIGSF